jgi:hypothetical protein
MRAPVEQVLQTATKLVDGSLDGREAVTILATLARDALPAATRLRQTEPDRAAAYATLLEATAREIQGQADGANDQAAYLTQVVNDLTRLQATLSPE